ncbi:hypothetical protein L804_02532 [Cryptococcus deuterogattii 2001/935-1]|nr:hypothetical protein L804_02532 [Cryptococcus deuterogattii 2001/935-1]
MSIEYYNRRTAELEQEDQRLQTSASSATITFQVPRTNDPSHTPSSLPPPFQHQPGQSDGQPQRINPQLPPPPPVHWSGCQTPPLFQPNLLVNHSVQTGMPPPPPVESARRLYDSWANTTQDPSELECWAKDHRHWSDALPSLLGR